MNESHDLVSTKWLFDNHENENISVIDASWYLQQGHLTPFEQHCQMAIKGSKFFDIEEISDHDNDLPHMLPSPAQFAKAMNDLGISNNDHIVVYDGSGMFSSPRLWWTLKYFGHEKVSVLDGGLPAWLANGYDAPSVEMNSDHKQETIAPYQIKSIKPELCVSYDEVKEAIDNETHIIIDARSPERFNGDIEEPRHNMLSGHMKGAINIPYPSLLIPPHNIMKPKEELKEIFKSTLEQSDKPIITTCGSGITACILSLALKTLGRESSVYDGSWAEWGRLGEVA